MPTYTHNPYLTQCQSICLMVLLCMLAPVRRHSMMIFVKQLKIYKNEIFLSCYKEVTITHKLRLDINPFLPYRPILCAKWVPFSLLSGKKIFEN